MWRLFVSLGAGWAKPAKKAVVEIERIPYNEYHSLGGIMEKGA